MKLNNLCKLFGKVYKATNAEKKGSFMYQIVVYVKDTITNIHLSYKMLSYSNQRCESSQLHGVSFSSFILSPFDVFSPFHEGSTQHTIRIRTRPHTHRHPSANTRTLLELSFERSVNC